MKKLVYLLVLVGIFAGMMVHSSIERVEDPAALVAGR
jgi:hypothetical protein